MPLYKLVGNRILSTFENAVVGLDLSEWHSGYRAYSVAALRDLPFRENADGYHFDTQIIIQFHEAGKRIMEIPIPTYYGDEISYVNGPRYAVDIVKDVIKYRAHKMGIGKGDTAFATSLYEPKAGADTATGRMLAWVSGAPAGRVLVVGVEAELVGAELRGAGHEVVVLLDPARVDALPDDDMLLAADLDDGIPAAAGDGFDLVVAVDALGRVRDSSRLLADLHRVMRPGARLVASVPNFTHWYPRARVMSGRWRYDMRGVLDEGQLHFFTGGEVAQRLADAGFEPRRRETVGLPRGADGSHAMSVVDGDGLTHRPTLFAYQYLFEVAKPAAD